jgi:hypothetical protein
MPIKQPATMPTEVPKKKKPTGDKDSLKVTVEVKGRGTAPQPGLDENNRGSSAPVNDIDEQMPDHAEITQKP